jgi:hypothetical protein
MLIEAQPRRELADHPVLAPWQHNRRENELVAPHESPDPPRYGATPGTRPARRQIYSVAAKAMSRAVMAMHQSGVMGKQEFQNLVSQPKGKQLSWDQRVNIARSQPESYGSRYLIRPQSSTAYEALLRAQMGL